MRTTSLLAGLLSLSAVVLAQDPATLERLFEAGRHQQVVDATAPDSAPEAQYIAGQSLQRLGADDQAAAVYARLAAQPDTSAWHFIGQSAAALLHGDLEGGFAAASRAVAIAPDQFEARFQLGLALARRQQWTEAAQAFDTAAQINPSSAYAHYYSGLMHYRANRRDRMAIHFEQFLKLAPEAPERPEVLQIMKTVRGR